MGFSCETRQKHVVQDSRQMENPNILEIVEQIDKIIVHYKIISNLRAF